MLDVTRRIAEALLVAVLAGALLVSPATIPGSTAQSAPVLPPANGRFDYQIGGEYPPAASVRIVDRDRESDALPGRYNICYVNAFQTQPGEAGSWPESAILTDDRGRPVEDDGWPGEYLLDTRTAATRAAILGVLRPWLRDCRARGFRAVEPDNLDSHTRSQGLLTRADNVAMATLLAGAAHAEGLAVAQKNDAGIAPIGRSRIGFDFAIVEECQVYDECDVFTDVYGDQVYEIEYTDAGGQNTYRAACAARGGTISIIYRDRDVVPAGDRGHTYQAC